MSTVNISDWNTAFDQIPWCFVLQTLMDHDSQLVLHAFWNVERVEFVVNQCWQTAVVLASVGDDWWGEPPHSGCIVKYPLHTNGVLQWTLFCLMEQSQSILHDLSSSQSSFSQTRMHFHNRDFIVTHHGGDVVHHVLINQRSYKNGTSMIYLKGSCPGSYMWQRTIAEGWQLIISRKHVNWCSRCTIY